MANEFEERKALRFNESEARVAEAKRIYKRLEDDGANYSLFTMRDAGFILGIFKDGELEPVVTDHDIRRLQRIERDFFGTNG